jgi:hypothetical protein
MSSIELRNLLSYVMAVLLQLEKNFLHNKKQSTRFGTLFSKCGLQTIVLRIALAYVPDEDRTFYVLSF